MSLLLTRNLSLGYTQKCPTILRKHGYDVLIYFFDHEPPHVHVMRAGGEVKIDLMDISVIAAWNMSGCEQRRAQALVAENKEFLMQKWDEFHE